MGTEVHLLALGVGEAALDRAVERLSGLEARWSRFRDDSEISRLNDRAGTPVLVSPETAAVVAAAVAAWHRTRGRFDPTVADAMRRCGYDRSFEQIRPSSAPTPPVPSPGCAGVVVDTRTNMVWLPSGVSLDVGGIAKGLAADWLTAQLLEGGASGASVNVGGDLRVGGGAGTPDGWVVAVDHPGRGEVVRVALASGAVATTSTRGRRWRQSGRERHHVIDPSRGEPVRGDLAGVTVIAGTAADAEVLCKAVLLSPPQERDEILAGSGAAGLTVALDGGVRWLAGAEAYAA